MRAASPAFTKTGASKEYRAADAIKRMIDASVSAGVLVAISPALVGIALAVKLDSPGPALYLGRRTGKGGIPFSIYKFRTMHVDAERLGTTTRVDDPRVTRIGRVLRKYKLDELPQFVNVLKGEMSLVGPRPEVEEHTSAYDDEEKAILSVKPGITDYASIRFVDLARELGTEDPHAVYVSRVRAEKNRLRLEYVRSRSLAVDCQILGRTFLTVVSKAFRSG